MSTASTNRKTAAQEAEKRTARELDEAAMASLGLSKTLAVAPLPGRREVRSVRTELTPESHGIINGVIASLTPYLGPGSRNVLRAELQALLRWAQLRHDQTKSAFDGFARHLATSKVRAFYRRISPVARLRERVDEKKRAAAATSEARLAAYAKYAVNLFKHAQVAWPNRWRVPARDPEDVIYDVVVDLIAFIRGEAPWEVHETRAGVPATLLFAEKQCRTWKKRRQIYDLTDSGFTPEDLLSPSATPEAIASSRSSSEYRKRALMASKPHMTRKQRGWLAEMAADAAWYEKVNDARVARRMYRSRSAAGKIKGAVRAALEREYDPEDLKD